MSSAPARGILPHRTRRHHHHHHHHQYDKCKRRDDCGRTDFCRSGDDEPASGQLADRDQTLGSNETETAAESRPKVNPIFLWAAQREQRIVEVRCEDYDKRNRIKLTKTAQGWRSIPRTVLTTCSSESLTDEQPDEQTTSAASQHEEKENSTAEVSTMKSSSIGELLLDDSRSNGAGRLDELKDVESRVRRKRKKHASCSRSKKRKADFERGEDRDEILVTSSWKTKKRKKYDKNKRRKKIRVHKDVVRETGADDAADQMLAKEGSDSRVTPKIHNVDDETDSEDSASAADTDSKSCVNGYDKSIASIEADTKPSDFQVIQKSRHLQPRVVLEPLHFPLRPTKTAPRVIKNKAPEVNTLGKKVIETMDCTDFAKNIKPVARRCLTDVEETVINNEDLQKILNKLDANHIPIDLDQTKSNFNDHQEIPRSCTKIGIAVMDAGKGSSDTDEINSECKTPNSISPVLETLGKLRAREKNKSRTGSKSLDETIERLEKSICSKHQLNISPDIPESDAITSHKVELQSNDKSDSKNVTVNSGSRSVSPQSKDFQSSVDKDDIENARSLEFLENQPELTVLLVNQNKDEVLVRDAIIASTLPDSQTEITDNEESHSDVLDCIVSKVESSRSTGRVDSPESTVNCSKREDLCDTRASETIEDEYREARIAKEEKSASDHETCNNNNDKYNKNLILGEKEREICEKDEAKDHLVDSTKAAIKKSLPNQNKCSEALAKLSSQPKYHRNDNADKRLTNELRCQASPQPSGLSSCTSPLMRSSSVYLERLLPSPPCSVSCSDDAKNDLTISSILSASSEDLKNAGAKETDGQLDFTKDSKLSSKYSVSVKNEKGLGCQEKKPFLQSQMQNLTTNKEECPLMDEELKEFACAASDYKVLKRRQTTEQYVDRKRLRDNNNTFSTECYDSDDTEYIEKSKIKELKINPVVYLDPASQLRELLRTSAHLIPDPLLVPRDYLPLIASAPLTEIPNLLSTRPELRLPEALSRPELLTDPDLLVISLAHLQHVLDHGETSAGQSYQTHYPMLSSMDDSKEEIVKEQSVGRKYRPKVSCKPIGKLMPAPMDLSNNQKPNAKPPLLRVRSGLLKQEPEVSSTANSPDDLQLWHPLFGSQKQRQQPNQQQQQQQQQQSQEQKSRAATWHRTTLTS